MHVLAAVWPLYFTKEEGEFSPYDGRAKVVEVFAQFFRGPGATLVKVGRSLPCEAAQAGVPTLACYRALRHTTHRAIWRPPTWCE